MKNVAYKIFGHYRTRYTFGSQSEGTTTPNMGSDYDWLNCEHVVNLFFDDSEWKEDMDNFLMVKDELTPPRHYKLMLYDLNEPKPIVGKDTVNYSYCYKDTEGRLLIKNSYVDREGYDIKHGPSRSYLEGYDIITAYMCNQIPVECLTWIGRPRRGHWPTKEMIGQACKYGVFVLPVGHPDSEFTKLEWRLSTSMLERVFMFSLNIVQIRTYILLKLFKNEILKPILGENFSSFICKTALLFTVESTPQDLWEDSRLCKCVRQCLITILQFLKDGFCPHYFIQSMNLFAGKVMRHEMKKVIPIIEHMVKNIPFYLSQISCERIGDRLTSLCITGLHLSGPEISSRYDIHCNTTDLLMQDFAYRIHEIVLDGLHLIDQSDSSMALKVLYSHLKLLGKIKRKNPAIFRYYAIIIAQLFCSHIACIEASLSIENRENLSHTALKLFYISMETDISSTKLKFASYCVCQNYFDIAERILSYVEKALDQPHVAHICGCGRNYFNPVDRTKALSVPLHDYVRTSVAFCVRFLRTESACVTQHFVTEMFRNENFVYFPKIRTPEEEYWMDMACVDSKPFCYYLQFIMYRTLENQTRGNPELRSKKLAALDNFCLHICDNIGVASGHVETAMNLLGHCFELDNQEDLALMYYLSSTQTLSSNNAANCHLERLAETLSE